jgi:hypothetical protein
MNAPIRLLLLFPLALTAPAAHAAAIVNGGFDADISGWEPIFDNAWRASHDSFDAAGLATSGSLLVESDAQFALGGPQQCVAVVPGAYTLSASVWFDVGLGYTETSATLVVDAHAQADCTDGGTSLAFTDSAPQRDGVPVAGAWDSLVLPFAVAPGTPSIAVRLLLYQSSNVPSLNTQFVNFDDVTLAPEPAAGAVVAALALAAIRAKRRGRRL